MKNACSYAFRIAVHAVIAIVILCFCANCDIVLLLSFCLRLPFHVHNSTLNRLLHSRSTIDYKPLQAITSRFVPVTYYLVAHTTFCRLIPYLYIYSVRLLPTYLSRNAQLTVCNRFMLIVCVSMDYIGVGCPYIPPKPVAQPCHDIFLFLYFLFGKFLFLHYSRIIFLFFFYINYPIIPHALLIFPCTFPIFTYRCRYPLYILYR